MIQSFADKKPRVLDRTYVHPMAVLIGDVQLGRRVHVAPFAVLRADEAGPIIIGDNVNIQDHVIIHGLANQYKLVRRIDAEASVYVGPESSIAHRATIHGPSKIGCHVFVGFSSVVHNSIIGDGCFIGHMALVIGVTIPAGRWVPDMYKVASSEDVARLPRVEDQDSSFNAHVVAENHTIRRIYLGKE